MTETIEIPKYAFDAVSTPQKNRMGYYKINTLTVSIYRPELKADKKSLKRGKIVFCVIFYPKYFPEVSDIMRQILQSL